MIYFRPVDPKVVGLRNVDRDRDGWFEVAGYTAIAILRASDKHDVENAFKIYSSSPEQHVSFRRQNTSFSFPHSP